MFINVDVRNVNQALHWLATVDKTHWLKIAPRGMETLECPMPVVTSYHRPIERVLFSPHRDANPFFHFFESLWIMAGKQEVGYLKQFNSNIASYSDNGHTFHAAYGHRLRYDWGFDQLLECVSILKKDRESRQAVACIWNPDEDLGVKSKDIPCNDLIMFKIRKGMLNMSVHCRSNDAIWGAYGANAVQFSVIQEFMARAVGAAVGYYAQVSDSFHIYTANEAWKRIERAGYDYHMQERCPYSIGMPMTYPLISLATPPEEWLTQCERFIEDGTTYEGYDPFFIHVASPMLEAWNVYKGDDKADRYNRAVEVLDLHCKAGDWKMAATEWLYRREENSVKEAS